MLRERFEYLTRHSQAWLLSMIASWDDIEKCTELMMKYVGTPVLFDLYRGEVDTFFIVQFEYKNFIGICPTKNDDAWKSNFTAFTVSGKFHPGISGDVKREFLQHVREIENKEHYTMVVGHSKGGANALYINYELKRLQFPNVESWAFDSPFICTDDGIEEMANHGVCHTNFLSKPYSNHLPSSPVDDVGIITLKGWGEHYGTDHELIGGAGLFDHSPLQITKNLAAWLHHEGYTSDANYMLELPYKTGKERIIKK